MTGKRSILWATPTRTNFDLPRLIFRLDTALNQIRIIRRIKIWSKSGSQKISVSSAKRRWDTAMDLPSKLPTLNPDMHPSWTALSNILPRASVTKTNNNGDNGSPCLKPLVLPKNPQGEPLIKMEKRIVDRQKKIYCLHLVENPFLSNIYSRKL